MTTYTKLRDGSWGLRVTGTAIPGACVPVHKKSGEQKSEVIGKVLWTGNGVSLCTISRGHYSSDNGNICAECGKHSTHLINKPDSSGIVDGVCPRCASMSQYERSYA